MNQVILEDLKKWIIDQYTEANRIIHERSSTGGVLYMQAEGSKAVLEKLCEEFSLGLTLANGRTYIHPEESSNISNSPFKTKIGISGPKGYLEIIIPVFDYRKLGLQNTERSLMGQYVRETGFRGNSQESLTDLIETYLQNYKIVASVANDRRTLLHRVPLDKVRDYDVHSLLFAIVERTEAKL